MKFKLIVVFVVILLLLVIGGVVVFASDNAVPGDFLYGLDRKVEEIQLNIAERQGSYTIGQQYLDFAYERVAELEKVVTSSNSTISLIPTVYADSRSVIPTSVNGIVNDIDNELLQAQINLGDLGTDAQQQSTFAQQISNGMTEVGYKISLLSARMNIAERAAITNLEDSINELDKSAFGVLLNDQTAANTVTTKTSTRIQKAQVQLTQISSELSSNKLDTDTIGTVQDLISTATDTIAKANSFYQQGKYLDAFACANQAFNTTAQASDSIELANSASSQDNIVQLVAQNRLNIVNQGLAAAQQALSSYSGSNKSGIQDLISQAKTSVSAAQISFDAADYQTSKSQAEAARDLIKLALKQLRQKHQADTSVDQAEAANTLQQVTAQLTSVQEVQDPTNDSSSDTTSSENTQDTIPTPEEQATAAEEEQQANDLVDQAKDLQEQAENANKSHHYSLANTLAYQANYLLSRAKSLYNHSHSYGNSHNNHVKGISTIDQTGLKFWF